MTLSIIVVVIFASLIATIFFLRWYLDERHRPQFVAQSVIQPAVPLSGVETVELDCLGFIGGTTDAVLCHGASNGDVWVAEWTEPMPKRQPECSNGRGRLRYYVSAEQQYRSEEMVIPGCGVLGHVRFQKMARP